MASLLSPKILWNLLLCNDAIKMASYMPWTQDIIALFNLPFLLVNTCRLVVKSENMIIRWLLDVKSSTLGNSIELLAMLRWNISNDHKNLCR